MKKPEVDLARLLPPSMRAQLGGRRFPVARLAAWLVLALGLIGYESFVARVRPPVTRATAPAVNVIGTGGFAIEGADGSWVLVLGSTRYPITVTADGAMVLDPAGGQWQANAVEDGYAITENDQPRFRMKSADEGYSVHGISGEVVYKVKLKDDKLNIYDADEKRVVHAKVKKGEMVVRDESDEDQLRIDSIQLLPSAVLALPIAPQARALGWVMQDKALLSR